MKRCFGVAWVSYFQCCFETFASCHEFEINSYEAFVQVLMFSPANDREYSTLFNVPNNYASWRGICKLRQLEIMVREMISSKRHGENYKNYS